LFYLILFSCFYMLLDAASMRAMDCDAHLVPLEHRVATEEAVAAPAKQVEVHAVAGHFITLATPLNAGIAHLHHATFPLHRVQGVLVGCPMKAAVVARYHHTAFQVHHFRSHLELAALVLREATHVPVFKSRLKFFCPDVTKI